MPDPSDYNKTLRAILMRMKCCFAQKKTCLKCFSGKIYSGNSRAGFLRHIRRVFIRTRLKVFIFPASGGLCVFFARISLNRVSGKDCGESVTPYSTCGRIIPIQAAPVERSGANKQYDISIPLKIQFTLP